MVDEYPRWRRRGWNALGLEIGPGDTCVRAAEVPLKREIPFPMRGYPHVVYRSKALASGRNHRWGGNGGGSRSPATMDYSFKGFRCQMFLLYSSIVRSEVNMLEQAVFSTAFLSHRSRSS